MTCHCGWAPRDAAGLVCNDRDKHAERFNHDLAAICEDFRKKEAKLSDRIVTREPKRIMKATGS